MMQDDKELTKWTEIIFKAFSMLEMESLVWSLTGQDLEHVTATRSSKSVVAKDIVGYFARRGQLHKLVSQVLKERPYLKEDYEPPEEKKPEEPEREWTGQDPSASYREIVRLCSDIMTATRGMLTKDLVLYIFMHAEDGTRELVFAVDKEHAENMLARHMGVDAGDIEAQYDLDYELGLASGHVLTLG